jgi:hypothetical protein
MFDNTSILRRKLYSLESESGTVAGSLGFLDTKRSVREISGSAKDIAIKIKLEDTREIQNLKEIANHSKVKCLKWYTLATNFILILVCVAVLADRVYECLCR